MSACDWLESDQTSMQCHQSDPSHLEKIKPLVLIGIKKGDTQLKYWLNTEHRYERIALALPMFPFHALENRVDAVQARDKQAKDEPSRDEKVRNEQTTDQQFTEQKATDQQATDEEVKDERVKDSAE